VIARPANPMTGGRAGSRRGPPPRVLPAPNGDPTTRPLADRVVGILHENVRPPSRGNYEGTAAMPNHPRPAVRGPRPAIGPFADSRPRGRAPVARLLLLALACGCGTVKTSGTARTGTEQLLLTNSWDSALEKIDFRPLTGVPVFLDTTHVTAVDQGWVISSLRQAMLAQGVLLRSKAEQAQWIVEARVGVYGTDSNSLLVGVPQLSVPPTFTGVPTGTIPEIPLIKKSDQQATSKLALFAYDRASGQLVWNSGTMLATATAKDTYIGGIGPIQGGTIRGGPEFIGVKIPLTSDSTKPGTPTPTRQPAPFDAPSMRLPASATDLESFAP